jgi:hypothetical protein
MKIQYFLGITVLFLQSCSNSKVEKMINDAHQLKLEVDELNMKLEIANKLAETNEPFIKLRIESAKQEENPKEAAKKLREIANEQLLTSNHLDSLLNEIDKREKSIDSLELLINQ